MSESSSATVDLRPGHTSAPEGRAVGGQLLELAVTNLGVIEHVRLLLGDGMTAITGETGAGKTLLLTALELLVGGRADSSVVGPHDDEACVEGRFVVGADEIVLQRIVPRSGRSRAYVNGRLATAAALTESGAALVEIHGQNAHTALGALSAQRAALDTFGAIDSEALSSARRAVRELEKRRDSLGGDERERLRQIELYRYQADEIDSAAIAGPDEDDRLRELEQMLAAATGDQAAAASVAEALGTDGVVAAALDQAMVELRGRRALSQLADQLNDAASILAEAASEARSLAEELEADPGRLAEIQERRRVLSDLRRKYGETLEDVLTFGSEASRRRAELENHGRLATRIDAEIAEALKELAAVEELIGQARREAAPGLAERVTESVRRLALPSARLEVEVGSGAGDEVSMVVSMNTGAPLQPLAKVASGGELARTMLALRLVLSGGAPVMVFDEVDAGVGGAAAHSVGAALARLAGDRQVLVVTHLAQVAAFADHQVRVVKADDGTSVRVEAASLDPEGRVVELSRMLSGSPDSSRARDHAAELLAAATSARRV